MIQAENVFRVLPACVGAFTIGGDAQASPGDQIAFAGDGGVLTVDGNVTNSSFTGGTLQRRG